MPHARRFVFAPGPGPRAGPRGRLLCDQAGGGGARTGTRVAPVLLRLARWAEADPLRAIPGTGCAHWVAHQKGIRGGGPTCDAGFAIRISDLIAGRSSSNLSKAKVGDIWTNRGPDPLRHHPEGLAGQGRQDGGGGAALQLGPRRRHNELVFPRHGLAIGATPSRPRMPKAASPSGFQSPGTAGMTITRSVPLSTQPVISTRSGRRLCGTLYRPAGAK